MRTMTTKFYLIGLVLELVMLLQSAQAAGPTGKAADKITILNVEVETDDMGALRIVYSDGTEVRIPKEVGRYNDGSHDLIQENFSEIQIADDHQHVGWLADYMICMQSYPCSAELVIFHPMCNLKHISPPYGIIFGWQFLEEGKKIVIRSGFPHGDDGIYVLYDTKTGRELAQFTSKNEEAPSWVQQSRLWR